MSKTNHTLRGRDIVVFSHDWSGDPLSKTHIVRILSKANRILWVNSIGYRTPTASAKDLSRAFTKIKSFVSEHLHQAEPNIFVLSPLALPIYDKKLIKKFNSLWLARQVRSAMRRLKFQNPFNLTFHPPSGIVAGKIGEKEIVYYCVDEYSQFTGVSVDAMINCEIDLMKKSDLVIVSAGKLYDDKKDFNQNTSIIRHGTDWRHFRKSLDEATIVPDLIANLPKPIIGFHGLLADWVDFELIKKTAEHFKDGSVVLIGKIAVDAEQKIKILDDVPNVHFLGRKTYSELPAYCKGFDVALNPFVINELTLAANPLKVREYLAAGLPVVSTDIPEVRVLEDCLVGVDHLDFIEKVGQAISYPKPREAVSDGVAHESWEAKVDELREILAGVALKRG
ncbi:glycosyltransferase family 1 protein [soil metagenome]